MELVQDHKTNKSNLTNETGLNDIDIERLLQDNTFTEITTYSKKWGFPPVPGKVLNCGYNNNIQLFSKNEVMKKVVIQEPDTKLIGETKKEKKFNNKTIYNQIVFDIGFLEKIADKNGKVYLTIKEINGGLEFYN